MLSLHEAVSHYLDKSHITAELKATGIRIFIAYGSGYYIYRLGNLADEVRWAM
ncbi:hypothetical protein KIH87_04510 [Paraneptunicella aestuarii]|uniref:hypothetical protein n=1 Tax=Paraneptunicella aestuarii TaxID=2831148 RepID=UPI001E519F9A|nr:hypothetical protein [Paraneptunicella aestuarii]UAA39626.1 hypothetical protein KIH87_04510 [Paraneptunicella aestuarii]